MKKISHQPDYGLMILFGIIIVFGLVMLVSASSVMGYNKFDDSYWYLKHQLLLGLLPGLFLFIVLSKIDYRKWKQVPQFFLWLSLTLLVLVFIPGIGAHYGKARSWIALGGLSMQPAELVKLTFLLYMAAWFEKRKEKVSNFSYGFIPFVIYLGLIGGLIIMQPDIGTLSIIVLMSLGVYFVAGAKLKHLALIIAGAIGGLAILIKIAPYRLARFTAFLNPEFDPQGIGYHINQALLAIGSGGWFGLGLGFSKQKFQYLPEVVGDSIFAIMAEELGFVVMVIFIILFLWMLKRIITIALTSDDFFGYLIGIGVGVWIIGQFFVNVGAMVGLLPLTGLPLPLVSYGGTAMIATMAAMGIVINISKYTGVRRKIVINKSWKK